MVPVKLNKSQILKQVLSEDIGTGDITTIATISKTKAVSAVFLAKDSGIISGLDVVEEIFKLLNPKIIFHSNFKNSSSVAKGQEIARVKGNGWAILSGERTALNFFQRMSGIATETKKFVNAVANTKAIILDTRKTVPGLRVFDKQAVVDGGGQNHRFGLFDAFLIKDNHIAAAGSITKAVNAVRKFKQHKFLEVEVSNQAELLEALSLNPNRIMLDNMSLGHMRQAVKIVKGKTPLEASGGVNLQTVSQIAKTGVDFISVGSLTHSVKALDISLEIT